MLRRFRIPAVLLWLAVVAAVCGLLGIESPLQVTEEDRSAVAGGGTLPPKIGVCIARA